MTLTIDLIGLSKSNFQNTSWFDKSLFCNCINILAYPNLKLSCEEFLLFEKITLHKKTETETGERGEVGTLIARWINLIKRVCRGQGEEVLEISIKSSPIPWFYDAFMSVSDINYSPFVFYGILLTLETTPFYPNILIQIDL